MIDDKVVLLLLFVVVVVGVIVTRLARDVVVHVVSAWAPTISLFQILTRNSSRKHPLFLDDWRVRIWNKESSPGDIEIFGMIRTQFLSNKEKSRTLI
jgi:hypothetical protein